MVRSRGWRGTKPASTTSCSLSCLNDVKCNIFNVNDALVKSIAAIISAVTGTPEDEHWRGNGQGGGGGNAGMDKAVRNETEGELQKEGGKNIIF